MAAEVGTLAGAVVEADIRPAVVTTNPQGERVDVKAAQLKK